MHRMKSQEGLKMLTFLESGSAKEDTCLSTLSYLYFAFFKKTLPLSKTIEYQYLEQWVISNLRKTPGNSCRIKAWRKTIRKTIRLGKQLHNEQPEGLLQPGHIWTHKVMNIIIVNIKLTKKECFLRENIIWVLFGKYYLPQWKITVYN